MPETLEIIREASNGQSAAVWMNRPDLRNALSPTLIAELTAAFQELGQDPNVRVIVLAGRGKAFCAGADLNHMRASANAPEAENRADARRLADLLHLINTCPKPVIARIHGACMAGGLGLASACDIVVASKAAKFALTETKLGLIPAMISPYVLHAIGERAARRWFLTAEIIEASEAWRIGIAHQLVEEDEIDERINALIASFLLTAPSAVAECKRLVRDVAGLPITPELITDTIDRLVQRRASDEGKEGLASFLEKRAPNWVRV